MSAFISQFRTIGIGHRLVVLAMSLGIVLVCGQRGEAQSVETRAQTVYGPTDTGLRDVDYLEAQGMNSLERALLEGDIRHAKDLAQQIMCTAKPEGNAHQPPWTCQGDKLDLSKTPDVFYVVWAGKDLKGALTLRRLLVPDLSDRPSSLDLPGLGTRASSRHIHEVFLANDKRALLASAYKSTRVEDPTVAQIPAAATTFLTPFFALAGAVAGAVPPRFPGVQPSRVTTPPPTVWITVSSVSLPYERASVTVTSRAQLATTSTELRKQAQDLADQTSFEIAGKSEVARLYAERLVDVVVTTARECTALSDWNSCLREFNTAINDADVACQDGCKPTDRVSNPKVLSDDDKKAKKDVEVKFRTFVEALPKSVDAETTFSNRPLAHVSFGTMVGFIAFGKASRDRVKLDNNGHVAADPLPRPLTILVVNWSPRGFDGASFRPTPAEMSQWFFGVVTSPDTGFATGWSRMLTRGLAANVGGGVMLSKGLRGSDTLGQSPTDGTTPFALSATPFVVVGASVNFTGK